MLEDHARRLLAELPAGEDLAVRVRDAIAPSLAEGEVTAAAVAEGQRLLRELPADTAQRELLVDAVEDLEQRLQDR